MRIRHPLSTEIVVTTGSLRRVHAVGADPIGVGRHPNSEIAIPSYHVARRHLSLFHEPDGLVVQDYHSAMGTFLNGQRLLDRAELHVGDTIKVGVHTELYFRHTCAGAPLDDAHEPFLRAILGAPTEVGPREVYADWLCERADPLSRARGELIAHQLAGQPADALLAEHEAFWIHFPVPVVAWEFRRGFVERVDLDVHEDGLAAARATLCTHHPILEVRRVR
jgi:uncharacterized protein (TIGR02996 family)